MNKHRLTMLTSALGLMAWGGLGVAQALPSYTPIVLNIPTPQTYARFSSSGAGIGDVNGDGAPDGLVGAPFQVVGGNDAQGQAFVFSGATGGLLRTLNDPTPQGHAYFGWSVAGIGDINGDGVLDVLVGAPNQDVGGNQSQGQAFVFSGATGGLLRALNDPTPQFGARFGGSVAGVGDVNGDGTPDILVGASDQDVGGKEDQGRTFVFSGATGGLLRTLNTPTSQAGAFFGRSVAGAGDVSSDGIPDLLVSGIWRSDYDHEDQVYVFSGANGQRLYTLPGGVAAGVGDVNGDGVPDILTGKYGINVSDNGPYVPSKALVFSGADGGLLHTLNNPTSQGYVFDITVAEAGDVNGDGIPDTLVGVPDQDVGGNEDQGQAFIFSGATGQWLYTFNHPTPQRWAFFGSSVAGVGDVNGDKIPDLLVRARGQDFLFVSGPATPRWVALNILPERINGQTQDVLPVAILTTPKFNAVQVDPLSVRLGPGQAQELHRQGHRRDVDGDGDTDLVLHFRTQAIGLGCGEQTVKLTGQTVAGQPIRAVDRLVVVGCQ